MATRELDVGARVRFTRPHRVEGIAQGRSRRPRAWLRSPRSSSAETPNHLDFHERAKLPDGSAGDGVAEFTLKGETVNDWTKLFAYHAYPGVPANPALAAETLGKTVKAW